MPIVRAGALGDPATRAGDRGRFAGGRSVDAPDGAHGRVRGVCVDVPPVRVRRDRVDALLPRDKSDRRRPVRPGNLLVPRSAGGDGNGLGGDGAPHHQDGGEETLPRIGDVVALIGRPAGNVARDDDVGASTQLIERQRIGGTAIDQNPEQPAYFRELKEKGVVSDEAIEKISWRNANRILGLGIQE